MNSQVARDDQAAAGGLSYSSSVRSLRQSRPEVSSGSVCRWNKHSIEYSVPYNAWRKVGFERALQRPSMSTFQLPNACIVKIAIGTPETKTPLVRLLKPKVSQFRDQAN